MKTMSYEAEAIIESASGPSEAVSALKTKTLEEPAGELQVYRHVVHHEDTHLVAIATKRRFLRRLGGGRESYPGGDGERKGGTFAHLALGGDLPTHGLHESTADRESQAVPPTACLRAPSPCRNGSKILARSSVDMPTPSRSPFRRDTSGRGGARSRHRRKRCPGG